MKQRGIRLTLVALLASAVAMGAGAPGRAADADLDKSPTARDVRARNELRAGIVPQTGVSYRDPQTNELKGWALDIVRAGAKRLGVEKVTFVESSWDGIIAGLQANRYDIAAAPLFQTDQRKAAIDFVDVWKTGVCFLALGSNTRLNSLEDLKSPSVRLATVQGSGSEQMVRKQFPQAQIVSVPTAGGSGAPVEMVLSGRADASQVDDHVSDAWVKRYCELKLIPEDCATQQPFALATGWGIRKGDLAWQAIWQGVVKEHEQLIKTERAKFTRFENLFPGEKPCR